MDFFENEINKINAQNNIDVVQPTQPLPSECEVLQEEKHNEENEAAMPVVEATGNTVTTEMFWGGLIKRQKRKMKRHQLILYVATITLAFGLGSAMMLSAVFGKGWLANRFSDGKAINFTLPIADRPTLEKEYYDNDGRYTTEGVANAVAPSVVSVVVYNNDISVGAYSQGSGIIFSENGYIVTNAHVVENATKGIKVVLSDDTEYSAKVVGSDVKSDIAVLKIAAKDLKPAVFCDSDQAVIGENVVAIGSPAGLYGSVTKGVISGKNRMIKTSDENIKMSCLQIDAAINPGNSGGALVNMWGQVVGITSSKLSSSQYEGIGFAISTNAAKPIIEDLIECGYVKDRIKIGITFYGVTSAEAEIYKLSTAGLYITDINKECDISKTELKVDDVITKVNGIEVCSYEELMEILKNAKPGDKVKANVVRLSSDLTKIESEFEIEFILMSDKSDSEGFIEK